MIRFQNMLKHCIQPVHFVVFSVKKKGRCVDIAWLLSNPSDMRIRAWRLFPCALAKWRTLYIRFVCYKWLNPVEISRHVVRVYPAKNEERESKPARKSRSSRRCLSETKRNRLLRKLLTPDTNGQTLCVFNNKEFIKYFMQTKIDKKKKLQLLNRVRKRYLINARKKNILMTMWKRDVHCKEKFRLGCGPL